jgi:3-deoxy-manno-octulosonate cytidylyltransferase (CMP-KDO synthetase)
MQFTVLIPARLASTRLPGKPLADIGGAPMVVRVAQQALQSGASRVVVAADSMAIVDGCAHFGIEAVLTRDTHASGSDRLAEASDLLDIGDDDVVVNVQGDEPMIDPLLIGEVAALLHRRTDCNMSTAAHAINEFADLLNPNIVKVVLDARATAMYFSRSPIPAAREFPGAVWWDAANSRCQPLRHVGIYAYRAAFLRKFPLLAPAPIEQIESLEQLRALWHGHRIAVHVTSRTPGAGVDTPEDLARARTAFSSISSA